MNESGHRDIFNIMILRGFFWLIFSKFVRVLLWEERKFS